VLHCRTQRNKYEEIRGENNMKITIGGKIGFKIMAKPYEPIDVSTTFLYEDNNEKTLTDEEVDTFNEKVNKQLEEQLKKKANIAVKVYKEARERLSKVVDS